MEVIREFSEEHLFDILTYRNAMPETWHYPDAAEYYEQQLRNQNTIHLLLKKVELPIEYLLAIPHNEAIEDKELRYADPELAEDPDRLYIETMEIAPEYARSLVGGKLCLMMLRPLHEEAGKRRLFKFSMHTRVNTGLNTALRKMYGDMLTLFRRIDNWPFYNGEEPTEYIEGTYRE